MTTKEIIKAEQGEKALTGFADNKGLEFLQEAMATEYAGMEFQLDRLKFPSAGATVFEVADDEESEAVKEIVGVIVLHHPAYAYYAEAYQGGHQPPDCHDTGAHIWSSFCGSSSSRRPDLRQGLQA